jgi:ferredoxin
MAYKIIDDCICCGACEVECKNNAIHEGETIYVINPQLCTECVGFFDKPQCEEVCPTGACVADLNHLETRQELLDKFQRLHPLKQ